MAYAHIPKDERRKFDSKAQKCVLLGYYDKPTKGYTCRLYDAENKIVYSRDVYFDEQPDDTVIGSKPDQNTDRLISSDNNDAEDEDTNDNEHSNCEQPPQLHGKLTTITENSDRTRQSSMYKYTTIE